MQTNSDSLIPKGVKRKPQKTKKRRECERLFDTIITKRGNYIKGAGGKDPEKLLLSREDYDKLAIAVPGLKDAGQPWFNRLAGMEIEIDDQYRNPQVVGV